MAAESGAKPATPGAIAEDDYEREARDWLENVYQGDTVRQLSPRAIIGGMLIGGLMSISNVYIGLKTGWGLGVTITSSIIAYAVFRALETVSPRIRRDPLTILENYTMSSAASAAGYMSTSGLVSSIPALYIRWWMGIVAVLLTFVLSIVAARATGETDITPISAMGQITQLVYGVVAPTNLTTNLMTASVTAGASAHSADLLTDLKSGYLLGGNARKQTISQLLGVVAGTLFIVPVYMLLVPDPAKLGETFAAPSAVVWSSVALMLAEGLQALPPGTFWAVIIGGVLGIALVLAEAWTPKKYHKFIPSAIGLGIAGIIPAFNSVAMFLGALAAWVLSKRRPDLDKGYTIPVSSGLIVGESLMAVSINLVAASSGIVDVIKQQL